MVIQGKRMPPTTQDYVLQVISPDGQVMSYGLAGTSFVIGRANDSTIYIPSESISRYHAELTSDKSGQWWIRDLDSRNGTLVNGQDVIEANIQCGDELEMGDYHLRLIEVPTAFPVDREVETQQHADLLTDQPTKHEIGFDENASEHNSEISTLSELSLPKIDTLHLSSLNEFGNRLTTIESPEERLALLCRLMVRRDFHGESAVVFRVNRNNPFRRQKLLCDPQTSTGLSDNVRILKGLLEVVVRTKNAAIVTDKPNDSQAEPNATIACPLHTTKTTMDILYVTLPKEYGTGEWLTLISHTAQTFAHINQVMLAREQLAEQTAIERELKRATQIQQGLVPKDIDIPTLEVAMRFEPSRRVGGDYIDVLPVEDECALITIADVSGKGLGAAMVASTLHSIVHTCQRTHVTLIEMVKTLNDHLCHHLDPTTFATMLFIALDPRDGKFYMVNAGHPVPVIIHPSGEKEYIEEALHYPLGIQPFEVDVYAGMLPEGSTLAIFTDGLTEIPLLDGHLLGVNGVGKNIGEVLTNNPHANLEEVADLLTMKLDALAAPGSEQHDDKTFLLLRRRTH